MFAYSEGTSGQFMKAFAELLSTRSKQEDSEKYLKSLSIGVFFHGIVLFCLYAPTSYTGVGASRFALVCPSR